MWYFTEWRELFLIRKIKQLHSCRKITKFWFENHNGFYLKIVPLQHYSSFHYSIKWHHFIYVLIYNSDLFLHISAWYCRAQEVMEDILVHQPSLKAVPFLKWLSIDISVRFECAVSYNMPPLIFKCASRWKPRGKGSCQYSVVSDKWWHSTLIK